MKLEKPIVIGIAGGTCSGKSSIAKILVEDLDNETNYTIEAYYRDSNSGVWLLLTKSPSSIQTHQRLIDAVEIYTIGGLLVKRIQHDMIEQTYQAVLSSLPKGVYLIRDRHSSRKFTKRR